jgi:hypothetical protein
MMLFRVKKRLVLTTTDLYVDLNRLSKTHQKTDKRAQSCNLQEVTRQILVASGTISMDGEGRSLPKDDLSPEISVYC